jgi:hypothetical protein
MVDAVKPGGVILDLQVIGPNPTIEVDGEVVDEIDGESLLRSADAAAGAIDTLVESGALIDQAIDDHDVHKHYANGLEVIEDFAGKQQRIPERAIPSLRALGAPCVVRSRCRLRLLLRH